MATFNAPYYDQIWGTVHRYDYCKDLAQRLVNEYSKNYKQILEVK